MDQNAQLEKKIRDIIQQVNDENATKSQYSVTKIPYHTHNGTDSAQVNESNLVRNIKNIITLGVSSTDTIRIKNIPNINALTASGVFFNNTMAPTASVDVQGHARFGRCYQFGDVGGGDIGALSTVTGIPFFQNCVSRYIKITGSGVTLSVTSSALIDNTKIISVYDGLTQVITVEITGYDNGTITLSSVVSGGWSGAMDLILS